MRGFYGFKLYLIINDQGRVISVKVTTANVANQKPVSEMANELLGCLYGDKYYISGPIGAGTCRQGSDTNNGCEK
ncbi:Mobile element protein [Candidatus Enterovibrio escicola]|uniref:Mobile element protein n=1 Tax=Candidatus Enterovibrio escicola TaxID=1927127 RepID=A0A2A5T2F3_9GAMM|nr:transposase [Candidatus Enterovibrio escacola]PCS22347.1 Mobile element protein [Candidatus Enterovibrio escacola]